MILQAALLIGDLFRGVRGVFAPPNDRWGVCSLINAGLGHSLSIHLNIHGVLRGNHQWLVFAPAHNLGASHQDLFPALKCEVRIGVVKHWPACLTGWTRGVVPLLPHGDAMMRTTDHRRNQHAARGPCFSAARMSLMRVSLLDICVLRWHCNSRQAKTIATKVSGASFQRLQTSVPVRTRIGGAGGYERENSRIAPNQGVGIYSSAALKREAELDLD